MSNPVNLTFIKKHEWRGISPDCKCPQARTYEAGKTYAVPEFIANEILALEGVAYGEEINLQESTAVSGSDEQVTGRRKKRNQTSDREISATDDGDGETISPD